MQQLAFLLKVSRPRFWIYVFGPYLVGAIAAISDKSELLDYKFWLFAIYFLLPANLLVYGINDIFDFETDKLNAKKRAYETLVVPDNRKLIWLAIVVTNLAFLIFAAFQSISAILAMLGFLFFSVFYSAPPIRAKTKPLVDSVFNILYVFPGIFVYFLMGGENISWIACAAAGFWTMAMHAYSAVPDITADKDARLKTIATWLGGKGTLIFCGALYLASGILTFKYLGIFSVTAAIAYSLMIIASLINYSEAHVFKVYRYFPWLNTSIGFALFWYIAIPKFF